MALTTDADAILSKNCLTVQRLDIRICAGGCVHNSLYIHLCHLLTPNVLQTYFSLPGPLSTLLFYVHVPDGGAPVSPSEWFNPAYKPYGHVSFPGGAALNAFNGSCCDSYTGYIPVDDFLEDSECLVSVLPCRCLTGGAPYECSSEAADGGAVLRL